MNQDANQKRRSLFPDGIGEIRLYWSSDVLTDAINTCADAGWRILEFDVSNWDDSDRLHAEIVEQLPTPEYYGRNLDALLDVLRGIADGSAGTVTEPGMALVLNNIERFASADARRLATVIDVLADAGRHGLRHAWPMAVLAKTNDPDIALGPISATPVEWNRAERTRASRG